MKYIRLLFYFCVSALIVCLEPAPWFATDFFVMANGNSSGNGSLASPWDLRTAFNASSTVKPGDIIYLRCPVGSGQKRCFIPGATGAHQ
jgi:hypothetical protein